MLHGRIEAFLAVARTGSVTRAAEELALTQPALTSRIQGLEQELGERLFIRESRGMRLTEAGRALLPYAERAVAALREGGERVASLRGERGGQLVIGAPPGVSTYTLPEILKRYATTYPGVTVNVRTGSSEAVLDLILRGEAQVGFGRLLRHPEIDCAPLFEEELVLVVDPEHAFVREPRVTVDDIALERVILFDAASSYYNVTWAWFDAARVRVRQTMELDNIEAAKRMVEHGLGVALLPQTAVQRDVREGRLRLIPVDGGGPPRRKIVAYLRRDHPAGREVTGFLRIAREMISQTTAEGGLRR